MNRFVRMAAAAIVSIGALNGLSAIAKADPIVVPQDIVFVFDASGSLGSVGFQEELDLMSDIVATFANDPAHPTRFGAIRFDTTIDTIYNLTDDQTPSAVVSAIHGAAYTGGLTHTRDAVLAAIAMFDAQSFPINPKTLVLITDGNPNPSASQGVCNDLNTLNALGSAGIQTKIVGIGTALNPPTIDCLIADTVTDFLVLETLSSYADLELQQGYVVTASVAEPASAALFAIAGAGILALRRRRAAA